MKPTILVFLVFLTAGAMLAQDRRPMPLDPLTPAEETLAQETALKDPRVRELLGENPDPAPTILFLGYKPAGTEGRPAGCHADVVFTLEPGRGGVRALVDLIAVRVVDVVRVNEMSVGVSERDINAARAVALRDERVLNALGGAERARSFVVAPEPGARLAREGNFVEALRTIGDYPPNCNIHRCVVLLFRSGGQYLETGDVIVDLNTQQTFVAPARRERP